MKAVDQNLFGFTEGNCFAACVASLLELPLDEVPNFCAIASNWFAEFNLWLRERGLYALALDLSNEWRPEGLHILSGPSPRGAGGEDELHSVVANGRDVVHDPHPSRAGLTGFKDVILLVPSDPARHSADVRRAERRRLIAEHGPKCPCGHCLITRGEERIERAEVA